MKNDVKCPKCSSLPKDEELWICDCGTIWNTFKTGGKCPKCNKIWNKTQCMECNEWSNHIDWYPNLKTKLLKEMAEFSIYIDELEKDN